jgi:hypothetical protein
MGILIPGEQEVVAPTGVDQDLRDYNRESHGWALYQDDTHTSGSPQALTANTAAILENDGATSITTYLPNGSSGLWDGANDKLTADASGDSYEVRVFFTIEPAQTNGVLTMKFDIGSDPLGASSIVIAQESVALLKGTAAQPYVVSLPIYSLGTFIANGMKIIVECDKNANVYGKSVLVVKNFSGATAPT